jgi:hypothetical protein
MHWFDFLNEVITSVLYMVNAETLVYVHNPLPRLAVHACQLSTGAFLSDMK